MEVDAFLWQQSEAREEVPIHMGNFKNRKISLKILLSFPIQRIPSGSCVTQVTEIPGSINIGSGRRGSLLTMGSITRQSFSAECAIPNLQTIVQEEEDSLLEIPTFQNTDSEEDAAEN